jgi:hypothetical protein
MRLCAPGYECVTAVAQDGRKIGADEMWLKVCCRSGLIVLLIGFWFDHARGVYRQPHTFRLGLRCDYQEPLCLAHPVPATLRGGCAARNLSACCEAALLRTRLTFVIISESPIHSWESMPSPSRDICKAERSSQRQFRASVYSRANRLD